MFSSVREFDNDSCFLNNNSLKNNEQFNESKTDKIIKDIVDVLKINLKSILSPVFTENERMNAW